MTAVAVCRVLSRMSSQLHRDYLTDDDFSSCVMTLVTGLLLCLRRIDEARSSSGGDEQLTQQLTRYVTGACRHLLRHVKSDVVNTRRLAAHLSHRNTADVSHLLETLLNDDNDDDERDNRAIN